MLLEPDRFRHTPKLAPERTHAPGKRPEEPAPKGEATTDTERKDDRSGQDR